jgi:hypothetical protein
VQLFRTEGQKFLRCPQIKGQAQNLAKGGDGLGKPVKIRAGTRDRMVLKFDSHPVPRDKTGQSRTGHSKTGKGSSETEKDILKQERMF